MQPETGELISAMPAAALRLEIEYKSNEGVLVRESLSGLNKRVMTGGEASPVDEWTGA